MISIAEFMCDQEPLSYGATAVYPGKLLMEKKYRFVSRFGDEVLLHRVVGNKLHLPRALCPVGPNDQRTSGVAVKFPKKPIPRENQIEVFEQSFAFLDKGQSGVVVAQTGWGKTVLGYAMAAHLGRQTLVVTTKEDIYKKWIDDAPKFLGLKPHQVGHIRGDDILVLDKPFVVAMIHTLARDDGRVTQDMLDRFGLVIFDECHRLPAETFSITAGMFKAQWRIGLSAHTERSDGKDLLLHAHLGPIRARTTLESLVPKILRYKTAWKCPRTVRTVTDANGNTMKKTMLVPHTPGKVAHIENHMVKDDIRNKMINDIALTSHKAGRKTIIFSAQVNHLKELAQMAIKSGVHHGDVGLYIGGGSKTDKLERTKSEIKPLLYATYGMMGEGTDLPWFDTAILATPRSAVEQPIGRIRREFENKREPVVFDLLDLDSPVFAGYAYNRKKWYNSIGCPIKDMFE